MGQLLRIIMEITMRGEKQVHVIHITEIHTSSIIQELIEIMIC